MGISLEPERLIWPFFLPLSWRCARPLFSRGLIIGGRNYPARATTHGSLTTMDGAAVAVAAVAAAAAAAAAVAVAVAAASAASAAAAAAAQRSFDPLRRRHFLSPLIYGRL
jgi:hypothetical protein